MILNGFLFTIGVIIALWLWNLLGERHERQEAEQLDRIRRTARLDGTFKS